MVFLIQNSQIRDGAAIQVKLDELIRTGSVQNSFVGIEHLSADELEELRARCEERAKALAAERRGAGRCGPPRSQGCQQLTVRKEQQRRRQWGERRRQRNVRVEVVADS
jgi:hypothetical protein